MDRTPTKEDGIMKKAVFAMVACALVVAFSGCGTENTGGAVSSGGNGSEQIVEKNVTEEREVSEIRESSSEVSELNSNADDVSTDETINIVWSRTYYWAMGSDYVYIDSDGKIYAEGEMENPTWSPSGASNEIYTGKQFTEEEFNAFLELKYDDEVAQKEALSKKGIKFGK